MTKQIPLKSPTEFEDIAEWRSYICQNVPVEDVDYKLACGRTDLYVRFYEMRGQAFPERFRNAIERIERSSGPERVNELELLNSEIFSDMTQFLFAAAAKRAVVSESVVPTTPREVAEELVQHMAHRNPYFAVWTQYQKREVRREDGSSWEAYVAKELGTDVGDEFVFTLLMADLGKLLWHYRDFDLALPPRTRYAMWFLHCVRGPERNTQTRALIHQLMGAISSCGSA